LDGLGAFWHDYYIDAENTKGNKMKQSDVGTGTKIIITICFSMSVIMFFVMSYIYISVSF